MVTADQDLVGRCTVEEGYARPGCPGDVQVEPERPFRMQEADRRATTTTSPVRSISSLPELICTDMWPGV